MRMVGNECTISAPGWSGVSVPNTLTPDTHPDHGHGGIVFRDDRHVGVRRTGRGRGATDTGPMVPACGGTSPGVVRRTVCTI